MSNTRLDLPSMLVDAKISEMRREAAQSRLVAEAMSNRERKWRITMVTAPVIGWLRELAAFGRRTEHPSRYGAPRPKTQSQTMRIPSA